MSNLTDLLHRVVDALERPADHPLQELHDAVDALEGAETPAPATGEAQPTPPPADEPSEPDTPAVHPVQDDGAGPEPETSNTPFGTESAPESG